MFCCIVVICICQTNALRMLVQFRKQLYIKFPLDYAVIRDQTKCVAGKNQTLGIRRYICNMLRLTHLQLCAVQTAAQEQDRLSRDDAGAARVDWLPVRSACQFSVYKVLGRKLPELDLQTRRASHDVQVRIR